MITLNTYNYTPNTYRTGVAPKVSARVPFKSCEPQVAKTVSESTKTSGSAFKFLTRFIKALFTKQAGNVEIPDQFFLSTTIPY